MGSLCYRSLTFLVLFSHSFYPRRSRDLSSMLVWHGSERTKNEDDKRQWGIMYVGSPRGLKRSQCTSSHFSTLLYNRHVIHESPRSTHSVCVCLCVISRITADGTIIEYLIAEHMEPPVTVQTQNYRISVHKGCRSREISMNLGNTRIGTCSFTPHVLYDRESFI